MGYDLIKAHLNLFAVMQNLEDLVRVDREMADLTKTWNVSLQFTVKGGPKSYVTFKDGVCTVGRGKCKRPSVKLFFTSAGHLNNMFDGKSNPIPLKGLTRLGFLKNEFPKLTDRLEYYLKPTDELLKDKNFLEINTGFTMNTAAFAARELALLDPIGKLNAGHIHNGAVLMKISDDGPAVHITFENGNIEVIKGDVDKPMACLLFKNVEIANAFLNNRLDIFTAIAGGDVTAKGQTLMLDALSLILDRIPLYLS
jgi:hypothetical protein